MLVACHDCDLLQKIPPLPPRGAAKCPRCGALLRRQRPNAVERTLALAVAGLSFRRGEPGKIQIGGPFFQHGIQQAGRPEPGHVPSSQAGFDPIEDRLLRSGIRISMDGKGRYLDNIFIERLWWTLKHQFIYLHSFEDGKSLRLGLAKWIQYYNLVRGHSSLDDKTPDEVYYGLPHPFAEAA